MKKEILRISILFLAGWVVLAFIPRNKSKELSFEEVKPIYLNTTYSFEERAADLVSRMTLEEKSRCRFAIQQCD